MTVKIDGTNGVLQAYDYQVLTTGFSYTFGAGTQTLIAVPAGTLATGTVTMPSAPADGMVITIQSSQQITALTVNGNTGQSIVGTAVQLSPNAPLSWVYRLTNTTWYPFAGEAGRASSVVTGTSVASTSGTSIDFIGIPSWVKRITVMLSAFSTNGSSNPIIQLGTSGGIQTTSYSGSVWLANTTNTLNSTGFFISPSVNAATVLESIVTICLLNSSTGLWVASVVSSQSNSATGIVGSGSKTLSGTLDRVRITTVGGTDTFDAGTINILYE